MGPVTAAAIFIPNGFNTIGIRDSKQMTAKQRFKLFEKLYNECPNCIAQVDASLIDIINIREGTKLAMRNAINGLVNADFAIIDGNFIPEYINIPAVSVIGGDSSSVSIAAASILAKCWRDREVEAMHVLYPQYNWEQNKGYGTLEHRNAIKTFGVTEFHRKTFSGVKEYVKTNRQS
jgi:ribonuclease HII